MSVVAHIIGSAEGDTFSDNHIHLGMGRGFADDRVIEGGRFPGSCDGENIQS